MSVLTAGWLQNRNFDLTFIWGGLLLATATGAVALLYPSVFIYLMLTDIWLLGYHHVIATYTKMAGTAADRKQNEALILFWLPAMLVFTLTMGILFGAVIIVTVYFFWQWFHYVRQSWGIAQRYRRKAGGMPWDNERLAEVTLWSIPLWGVLYRCWQQPQQFIFLPIWTPAVPLILVQIVGAISLTLLAWWVVTRVQAYRRGELALGHTLYMLSHFFIFAVGYIAIENINTGWLMVNIWHNSQYVVFVWLYNRQRFADGPSAAAPRLSWLSQAGALRGAFYFMACVGLSTIAYTTLYYTGTTLNSRLNFSAASFVVIFAMAINFHHYVVDSVIWKRKHAISAGAAT